MAAGYLYILAHGQQVALPCRGWVVATPDSSALTPQGVVMAYGVSSPIRKHTAAFPFVLVRPIDDEGNPWPCDEEGHQHGREWCAACTQPWAAHQVVVKEPYEEFRSKRQPRWGDGRKH